MSGGGSSGDKTEKATPKKRKKARRDGGIGNTPEIGAWLSMLAATFVIPHVFSSLFDVSSVAMVQVGAVIQHPEPGRAITAALDAGRGAFSSVLPLSVMVALIGVVSVVGQGAVSIAPKLLKPTFKRLNPLSGLKRMFGPHAAWALVKALLKTAALAAVVTLSVRRLVPTVMGSGMLPVTSLITIGVEAVLTMLRYAAVAGLLMAFADYAVVRKRNNKQLKMTKQEVRDEHKSQEGDPHQKGAIRSRQMAMRRSRMMADVPIADVIIVNPTHIAVALVYDPTRGAPRVVAKGADHVAARIRALAELHRIPMVSDVPLARTLHSSCDIGQEVPPDLYKAVATVLAFVMTLKKRGSAAGTHTVRVLAPTR